MQVNSMSTNQKLSYKKNNSNRTIHRSKEIRSGCNEERTTNMADRRRGWDKREQGKNERNQTQ